MNTSKPKSVIVRAGYPIAAMAAATLLTSKASGQFPVETMANLGMFSVNFIGAVWLAKRSASHIIENAGERTQKVIDKLQSSRVGKMVEKFAAGTFAGPGLFGAGLASVGIITNAAVEAPISAAATMPIIVLPAAGLLAMHVIQRKAQASRIETQAFQAQVNSEPPKKAPGV